MSDHDPSPQLTPIPEGLKKQLDEFQETLWKVKITEALLAGFFGLLVSFLIVFILDRFIATPPLARLGILLAGSSLFAIFAPLMIRRWVYGHRREGQLARLIAKKYPKLGDRLLGVVELQDQQESKKSLSPALREAAMAHVARQIDKKNLIEALPVSSHKKLAIGVCSGVLVTILGFSIAPKAGANALKRWALPFSATERYTFTKLDLSKIPNPLVVPYDEPFILEIPLNENSDERPETARARYGLQDWLNSVLSEENTYRFEFSGQQTKDTLTLRAGDASHKIRIEPEIRPELTDLSAEVQLPDYLQLERRTFDLRSGALTTLQGSQITLKGIFSRDLAKATAEITPLPIEEPLADLPLTSEGKSQPKPELALPDSSALALSLTQDALVSDPIELQKNDLKIPLSWTDIKGLESSAPFQLKIRAAADEPPLSYLQGVERQIAILASETLEFEVIGEDDFGLREMGLSWKGEFTKPTNEEPATGSMILKSGAPHLTRLNEQALFSPQAHGILPQKLLLSAYSQDYLPGRPFILSEPITIYILTPDEHAQLLKKRFDRLISELEEAARREQNNLDTNRRLDQLKKAEELQNEEGRKELAKQEDAEDQNTEKLADLAERMEELFEDAARNESIDQDTMKKLSETMQNLQELSQKDLPEVEEKLSDAQNEKSTPEKAKRDLQEAIEKQKEALKKMRETIEKANNANENFEASTFVNRLKRAASDEDGIASSLISAMQGKGPKNEKAEIPLLGANPGTDNIDPIFERLVGKLSDQQKSTTSDVRWIQEDLGRFYVRTQKKIHKELFEEMKTSQIDLKLESLQRRIQANQSFLSALESRKVAEQLRVWAKKLAGDQESGGSGDGGDGGTSAEDIDFEFMLKVMRMVQKEQGIRSRTRSLEQLMRSVELRKANPIEIPQE